MSQVPQKRLSFGATEARPRPPLVTRLVPWVALAIALVALGVSLWRVV